MSEKLIVKASMSSDELKAMRQQIREMETEAREREKDQRAEYRQAIRDFGTTFFGKLSVDSAEQVKRIQKYLITEDTLAELQEVANPVEETEVFETSELDYGQPFNG